MPVDPGSFRIGVTGSRAILASIEPHLRTGVGRVLDQATSISRRFGFYRCTVISPLAEGADRLVAEEGLRRGFALIVPLPFAVEDYERDFPETAQTFRHLVSRGETIELGGSRLDAAEGYERAGHFVVDHSDLLLTIWNGRTTGFRGGTSAIIEYAATRSMPILWFSLEDRQLRWSSEGRLSLPSLPAPIKDAAAPIEMICEAKRRSLLDDGPSS